MFIGYTVASETGDVKKRITTSVQAIIWFFLVPLWQYPLSQRPSPLNSDSGSRPEREGRATALSLAFATLRKLSLACGARNLKIADGKSNPPSFEQRFDSLRLPNVRLMTSYLQLAILYGSNEGQGRKNN